MWVKIPTVDYDDDTTFYVWYGNSSASAYAIDATYGAENVWDSNYMVVHHLEDTTTSTITDSSTNDNDGTKKAANEPLESVCQITNGQTFNGTSHYISLGKPSSLSNINRITVSAWIKVSGSTGTSQNAVTKMSWEGSYYNNFAFGCNWTANKAGFYFNNTSGQWKYVDSTTSVTDGNWYYIVGVLDASYQRMYVNGVDEKDVNTGAQTINSNNAELFIGGYETSGDVLTGWFKGSVDEVRCSNIDRSAGWIATEYANQSAPATFVTEGTETSAGLTVTPSVLTVTSVINSCTVSTVMNVIVQPSEQTLTSSQPEIVISLVQNVTTTTATQSLTVSQKQCTVYPLTPTANNIIYIANRDEFAVKVSSTGNIYWGIDE